MTPDMSPSRLGAGHLLALAGSGLALLSLWLPWYVVHVPAQLRDMLGDEGARTAGPLGSLAQGLAAILPEKISASGWTELRGADVVLCVAALAVLALLLAIAGALGTSVTVDASVACRWIAVIGGAGLALTVEHVIARPFDGAVVDVAAGLWVAVAGSALMLVGGLLAATPTAPEPALPTLTLDRPVAPVDASASVAPPRA
jgi:hypothetical protein